LQGIALSASSPATRAVAEVLGKGGIVFLHSRRRAGIAPTHGAVDYVKACLPLIQPQLEVGAAAPWEVLCTPFDVEDAVGRSATYRCEYAGRAIDQIQVVPVREDRVVVGGPRRTDVAEGSIGSRELGIAVGRKIDGGEGLVVQRVRERQRDGGDRIVPVIAYVGRAWHDTAPYLSYHVLANTSCRRCGSRWGR
jgi:hypothetical protein